MATPQLEEAAAPEGSKRVAREVAQRLFAAEFNQSKLEIRETGERAPAYLITPLGARVNRLFVVGVLTSNETVGQTGEMYRAQVTDPTGVFNVFAGQYQPQAARALSEIRPPAIVAIVGKSRVYSPEENVVYTSIRPETIHVVDVADRDHWILDAAKATLERLECVREATAMTPATAAALKGLGCREDHAEGAVKAIEHYGPPDAAKWAAVVRDALEILNPGSDARRRADDGFTVASALPAGAESAPRAASPPPPQDSAAADAEEAVLALVEKFDDGKGAHWKDVVAEASKSSISEEQVEEALNSLMDKGLVYEPVLGRLRRAD